jgi:putative chitinase
MVDVFISYARLDRLRVEILNEALQELGLSTFFDVTGIDGGDTFPDTLDRAVKSAGAVVACWTPHALQRDWVKTECLIALERKALVPVEIESVTALDIPAAFFPLQRVNLTEWHGEREHPGWVAAVRGIAKKLGRPDLYDRARAAAAVKGTVSRTKEPAAMDILWRDWMRLAGGSDGAALASLLERATDTVVASLAAARIADLERPAIARLTGGSISIGLPPRRGWALARFVALWTVVVAAIIVGATRGYVYLDTRAKTAVATASAERDRLAAENETLIRQLQNAPSARATALVRTNAFLRGLTRDRLAAFFASYRNGMAFADGLLRRTDILARAEVDTPLRLSHFLAQLTHETNGFAVVAENPNYSAQRLVQMFASRFKDEAEAMAYDKQPERIANRIYANRMGNGDEASGDGWRYRGRGFIGLTGRANYRALGETIGVDLEANPDQMFDPEVSLAIAAAFWSSRKLNDAADADDIRRVTRAFNGGLNGLADRQRLLDLAKKTLDIQGG